MAAGLGKLHLAPRDFWAMTPRELDAALRGHYDLAATATPLSRSTLDTLIAAFPDAAARPPSSCASGSAALPQRAHEPTS